MTNGNTFWAIVTAAATGAVIGMLFAPEEGSQTRRKIKRSANDWATDMLDNLEKGKDKVRDAASRLQNEGQDLKNDLSDSASKAYDSAKESASRTRTDSPM
jgi:gas vesicle protein